MKIKTAFVATALLAGILTGAPAGAQSMASKLEQQGQARYVALSGLMAKERNGFLTIQMELQNTDSDPRRVFWRIKWLDETGFQVWDDEPWKPLLLQAATRQNVQAIAPTPSARDFRIQLNAEENWSSNSGNSNPNSNY